MVTGRLVTSFVFTLQDAPFISIKENEDGTFSYKGYCIDLLHELAKKLHFTYEIYPSPDGFYGGETENGSWNGMVAELINKVSTKLPCSFE